MNKGYLAAFAVYLFWGLSPVYWKVVSSVPAPEILGLRILWAVPFLLALISYSFENLYFYKKSRAYSI